MKRHDKLLAFKKAERAERFIMAGKMNKKLLTKLVNSLPLKDLSQIAVRYSDAVEVNADVFLLIDDLKCAAIIERYCSEMRDQDFNKVWTLLSEICEIFKSEPDRFIGILTQLSYDFYRSMAWSILECIKESGMGIFTFEADLNELLNFVSTPAKKVFDWLIANDSKIYHQIFNLVDDVSNKEYSGQRSDQRAWGNKAKYFTEEGDPLVHDWDYAPWFWHEERKETML